MPKTLATPEQNRLLSDTSLISAGSPEKVQVTAQLAATHGWSDAETRRFIQHDSGTANRRMGSGRRMKAPNDLASGMRQLTDELRLATKRIQLLQELAAADASQVDLQKRLTKLAAALTKIISLEERSTSMPLATDNADE